MGPVEWNVWRDFPPFSKALVFSLICQFTDFTASESGNIFTCPTYLCTISLPNSLRQTAYVKGWNFNDYWVALNHWGRTSKHIRDFKRVKSVFKLWQTRACCRSLCCWCWRRCTFEQDCIVNMVLTLPSENLCPSTVQIDMAQLSGEYLVIMMRRKTMYSS